MGRAATENVLIVTMCPEVFFYDRSRNARMYCEMRLDAVSALGSGLFSRGRDILEYAARWTSGRRPLLQSMRLLWPLRDDLGYYGHSAALSLRCVLKRLRWTAENY